MKLSFEEAATKIMNQTLEEYGKKGVWNDNDEWWYSKIKNSFIKKERPEEYTFEDLPKEGWHTGPQRMTLQEFIFIGISSDLSDSFRPTVFIDKDGLLWVEDGEDDYIAFDKWNREQRPENRVIITDWEDTLKEARTQSETPCRCSERKATTDTQDVLKEKNRCLAVRVKELESALSDIEQAYRKSFHFDGKIDEALKRITTRPIKTIEEENKDTPFKESMEVISKLEAVKKDYEKEELQNQIDRLEKAIEKYEENIERVNLKLCRRREKLREEESNNCNIGRRHENNLAIRDISSAFCEDIDKTISTGCQGDD
ncbi:MAG: hypothetical protein GY679_01800 [Mycoplasma sp.]|nr:hypothetical protein [Mycoplasma sp.]